MIGLYIVMLWKVFNAYIDQYDDPHGQPWTSYTFINSYNMKFDKTMIHRIIMPINQGILQRNIYNAHFLNRPIFINFALRCRYACFLQQRWSIRVRMIVRWSSGCINRMIILKLHLTDTQIKCFHLPSRPMCNFTSGNPE